jgi:hypothetical protein
VALSWLLNHIKDFYSSQPADLVAIIREKTLIPGDCKIAVEADESWSFVGSKENQQWL